MKRQTLWTAFVVVLALVTLWNLNVILGQVSGWNLNLPAFGQNSVSQDSFNPLVHALTIIQERFYRPEEVDQDELIRGSLQGLVDQLEDPYSAYLPQEDYERFNRGLEGEFVGVGIHIGIRDGRLTIIAPIEGSPAHQAGARAGDLILKIDGDSTEGITLDDAVSLLRGEQGTQVLVEVEHRDGSVEVLTIVRDVIHVPTVETRLVDEGRVGYVRLMTFNENAGTDVRNALDEFKAGGAEGVILDLRGNGGGLLNQALNVVSQFVDDGLVLTTKGPQGTTTYQSRGNGFENLPLAVLIDGGTASASEIVAGAIQDADMGVLVGQQTFGKGVVQSLFPLVDGSYLKLTTSEYITPSGRRVQGQGLVPDIPVPDPLELLAEVQSQLEGIKPAVFSREARGWIDAFDAELDALFDPISSDEPAAAEQAAELLARFRAERALLANASEADLGDALDALEAVLVNLADALDNSSMDRALDWLRAHVGQRCPCDIATASNR